MNQTVDNSVAFRRQGNWKLAADGWMRMLRIWCLGFSLRRGGARPRPSKAEINSATTFLCYGFRKPLFSFCHCEHLKGARQSALPPSRLLRPDKSWLAMTGGECHCFKQIQMSKSQSQLKSKCLNAQTTSFSHLGFELDLAFELCHLSLL